MLRRLRKSALTFKMPKKKKPLRVGNFQVCPGAHTEGGGGGALPSTQRVLGRRARTQAPVLWGAAPARQGPWLIHIGYPWVMMRRRRTGEPSSHQGSPARPAKAGVSASHGSRNQTHGMSNTLGGGHHYTGHCGPYGQLQKTNPQSSVYSLVFAQSTQKPCPCS